MRRKTLFFLLRLVLGLGGLVAVFVFSRAKFPEIGRALQGANWALLVLSFSLHAFGLFASAYRWQILAKAQGDRIPLGFLTKSYLIGKFFNTFLPTSFGGDVVRIWDGSKFSSSIVKSSAIVVVERMTGVIVLFLFALVASLGRLEMAGRVPFIGAAMALGFVGLAGTVAFLLPAAGRALRRGPTRGFIRKTLDKMLLFREAVVAYRRYPKPFFRAMLWAVLLQLNVILYFILIGKALGLPIPAFDYFIFIPLVLLVQMLPVTINGLGVREGAYVAIFAYYGLSSSAALSYSFIDLAYSLIIGAVGALLYLTRK
ncbi:MAG: lysylphosphatidylglycerol synthase transmembrane domain-containing protein [Candidatus Aminicenantes bacterium]|nr:lysylphosphatidylglycerol synthase transmembrane domain-containing protein [Candidatus Aminicenantes bacterium]